MEMLKKGDVLEVVEAVSGWLSAPGDFLPVGTRLVVTTRPRYCTGHGEFFSARPVGFKLSRGRRVVTLSPRLIEKGLLKVV